jgi:hypothetical protein
MQHTGAAAEMQSGVPLQPQVPPTHAPPIDMPVQSAHA